MKYLLVFLVGVVVSLASMSVYQKLTYEKARVTLRDDETDFSEPKVYGDYIISVGQVPGEESLMVWNKESRRPILCMRDEDNDGKADFYVLDLKKGGYGPETYGDSKYSVDKNHYFKAVSTNNDGRFWTMLNNEGEFRMDRDGDGEVELVMSRYEGSGLKPVKMLYDDRWVVAEDGDDAINLMLEERTLPIKFDMETSAWEVLERN